MPDGGAGDWGCQGSVTPSKSVHLADIVYQGEPRTHPLYINFQFGAQGEAVHALLNPDIGKHQLNNTQPPGIDLLSFRTIYLGLPPIVQVTLMFINFYGKLPAQQSAGRLHLTLTTTGLAPVGRR